MSGVQDRLSLTVNDKEERVRELWDRYGLTMQQHQEYIDIHGWPVKSLPVRIQRRTFAKPEAAYRQGPPQALRVGVALAAVAHAKAKGKARQRQSNDKAKANHMQNESKYKAKAQARHPLISRKAKTKQ